MLSSTTMAPRGLWSQRPLQWLLSYAHRRPRHANALALWFMAAEASLVALHQPPLRRCCKTSTWCATVLWAASSAATLCLATPCQVTPSSACVRPPAYLLRVSSPMALAQSMHLLPSRGLASCWDCKANKRARIIFHRHLYSSIIVLVLVICTGIMCENTHTSCKYKARSTAH